MPGFFTSGDRAESVFEQETPELIRTSRMPQLPERLRLYLTDAFAGDVKLLADFLERVVGIHVDAEAHPQHLGFAWRQAGKHGMRRFLEA